MLEALAIAEQYRAAEMSEKGRGLTRDWVRISVGLLRNRSRGAAPEWRDCGSRFPHFLEPMYGPAEG
jgi:hypothetical protein